MALFEKYKDDSEDFILSEGIEEFCIDLQLKPDEFKVLGEKEYHFWKFMNKVINIPHIAHHSAWDCQKMSENLLSEKSTLIPPVLAWKFEAEQMCRFSRAEFITGKSTIQSVEFSIKSFL